MKLGFVAKHDARGATLCRFGDAGARFDNLLSSAEEDGIAVAFLGRLYYASELRRRLPPQHRPSPTATPAAHALAAFRIAGAKGLAWLEGDYSVVVHDGRTRRLFAQRDPLGGFPLFWIRAPDGRSVVVATSMRSLVRRLPRLTVSPEYVAEFLMQPGCGMVEPPGGVCAFEGVHRVAAGGRLVVGADSTAVHERWWDWKERADRPGSLRPENLASKTAELLGDAVRERSVHRTAAHVSGGIDSTVVALLAAQQARQAGNPSGPVHALSLVYRHLPVLARETPFVEAALASSSLIAHRLPGDELLDFGPTHGDNFADEPCVALTQSSMARALTDAAAALEVETVLSGVGADELFGQLPYHLSDLLRAGNLLDSWRESERWGTARGFSRWRYLWQFGLAPAIPAQFRGGLANWWRGGRAEWRRQGPLAIPPWVRPEFASRYCLFERGVEHFRLVSNSRLPKTVAVTIATLERTAGDSLRWELDVPRGLLTTHPYRDPRLVRFCLGWQGEVRPDPSRQKPILVDAFRGLLPATIRERRRKGHFEEVYFGGLARHLPRLEALVSGAQEDELEFLDRDELLCCLRASSLGAAGSSQCADRLSLTLCLLEWLSLQSRWMGEYPTEVVFERAAQPGRGGSI